jgi:anti-sigma factor RsiW
MTRMPEAPIGEDDLHAFIDGVLDPLRMAAVQAFLAARPDEAARLRAIAAQRDALRAALAFKAAEPIPARLRIGHLRSARRQLAWARGRVAVAAMVLLMVGAGLGWGLRASFGPQMAEIERTQPPALEALPAPVARIEASVRTADIGAWLRRETGQFVPVPDLTSFGFALDGAMVLPAPEGAAAMLRFVDAGGVVLSVWRRPSPDPVSRRMRCTDEPGGAVTYSWSNGRHLHLVTAQLPRERLRPIALEVERAMEAPPEIGVMAGLGRRPCETALG